MPKLPTFEVETIPTARRGAPVFVRLVSGGPFDVRPGSTLGGFAIQLALSPRALHRDGTPRTDLYAFLFAPSARKQLVEGQRLVLESPDTTCAGCNATWVDPPLEADEVAELRALLVAERRVTFVHRLQELTGLGFANAKRVLDHCDFHFGCCTHCDADLERGFRVTCAKCGGVTYRWFASAEEGLPGESPG